MDAHVRPNVFISYARSDGEVFAKDLRQRLEHEAPGIRLWQDRTDMEGGIGWWNQIAEALDVVEVMILVATPTAIKSPVVSKEWRYARQQGVRIYPVKGTSDAELDFPSMPRWMRKSHFYDLDVEWAKFLSHLRSAGRATRVPFMAPDLPDGFVARPREFDQLLKLVLDADRQNPVAIATAIHGAGGFGKTTLAAALCHTDQMITAFDDGILWISLGEKPSVLDGLIKLHAALTGEHRVFLDAEEAAAQLANRLADKNCLIVIDDVWDSADLRPFLRGGKECARLITTRNFDIAAHAERVDVDEMTPDQSVQMLIGRMTPRPANLEPFRALAHRLGEWPLMLELARDNLHLRVKRGDTLSGAIAYLNQALDKKGVRVFDRRNSVERRQSVARTIEVSLDLLTDGENERFLELAIFPEDTTIPLNTIGALWNLDEFDTEELVQRLGDLSLLKFELQTSSIRLHDMIRAYLAENLGDKASSRHARLIDSWSNLHELPDSYGWTWVAYHLIGARRSDALRQVLLDFGWMRAKLEATDPNALLADYDRLLAANPKDDEARLIQGAIRLSAHILARDKDQLSGQLHGRLLPFKTVPIERLLAQVRSSSADSWLRPLVPCLSSPGGALLRIFTGHEGGIKSVAVMPDGRHAISASQDHTLRVWDLDTGQELRILAGHAGTVNGVAVSPDGRQALSASDDRTLRLWDVDAGQEVRVLPGHGGRVHGVAFMPDGRRAVSASGDQTLRMWDLETGRELCRLRGHRHTVTAVAITPDGRFGISASQDLTLRLWDLETGKELRRLVGQEGGVGSVAVTPDGRHALSSFDHRTIWLWDLDTGEQLRILTSHDAVVNGVAATPDGRQALSASEDRTLRLWDLENLRELRVFTGHEGSVRSVALTLDGRRALSASDDKTLRLWDLGTAEELGFVTGHRAAVNGVVVMPDGRRALSASDDHSLGLWDLETGKELRRLYGQEGGIRSVAVTPDGRYAVSASEDKTIWLWDLHTGQPRRGLRGHKHAVNSVVVTPDGRRALSGSEDRTLRLWDLDSGQELLRLSGHPDGVRSVAVTPDGRRAVSASDDWTLRIWDLDSGRQCRRLRGHSYTVSAVVVAPDGRHVLSSSEDRTVRLWDLDSGLELRRFSGHEDGVRSVAMAPDGRRALSASYDRTLRLWDLESGRTIASFYGDAAFRSCSVGPDARTVVAGDTLGRLHILWLEGCEPLAIPTS
jgi:WD40 repeat protein